MAHNPLGLRRFAKASRKTIMIRIRQPTTSSSRRRGLAPLELTLALPMLVIMMALMINFGVIASWKVRTQGNAHYATFRSLLVRTGDWNPPPDNWPNASLQSAGGNPLPSLGALWDAHPDTSHPRADWARGSWLTAPNQTVPVRVEGRLEFDDGVHSGAAAMQRRVPLLRGATSNGQFGFNLSQSVLDNRWQFHSLGIGDNLAPRGRVWWDIEHNDLVALDPEIGNFKARLDAAQQQLLSNPHPEYLYPLDQDVEFRIYYGQSPDFYPRLGGGCSLDVNDVRSNQFERLLTRIERLPCTMSRSFLGLYREWICRLERCQAGNASITPLQNRYDDLRQLVNALPPELGCGQAGLLQPCDACDPMDAQCLSQCPAPTPDADGL